MKDLLIQTLINIYVKATNIAQNNNQVVGENRDFYITLEQLMNLFNEWK